MLRERFASRGVGIAGTLIIVFFLFAYLLAQFKAGSKILSTLLRDVPVFDASVRWADTAFDGIPLLGSAEPDYALCLLVFGFAVIAYVTYGGFRAVVWTDVMQGIVMATGLVVLLALALHQVGGLGKATRELEKMTPPEPVTAVVTLPEARSEAFEIPKGTWLGWELQGERKLVRTKFRTTIAAGNVESEPIEMIRITTPERIGHIDPDPISSFTEVRILTRTPYAWGAGERGVYVTAPGPSPTEPLGFLAIGMAISFFIFWPFGGVGQPSSMVRLMAPHSRDTAKADKS